MPYKDTKVYSDGSHYIAIPPENFPSKQRKRKKPKPKPTTTPKTDGNTPPTPKDKFETAYKESQSLPKRERKKYITEKLQGEFETAEQAKAYTDQNIERKKINAAKRRARLWRKVRLQSWNYFVTFTFDSAKHDETTSKEALCNTLKHAVSRNGWKYIGVWERSPDKQRLHFHGIFHIPENAMIGELKTVTDYSGTAPVTVYSNKVDTVIRTPYELNANAYCQIIYVCDCGCAIDDCCDCPVIY